jgi:pyruvate dehydrogenase E2 component (dihydrolipoamide acetyltransferase)
MAYEIIMPKTEMAMEEGTIVRWLKKEGESVEAGEPILEIESDKATAESEAENSGVLLKIVRSEGETVPVTEVIGYIGQEGEEIPGASAAEGSEPAAGATAAAGASGGTERTAGSEDGASLGTAQPAAGLEDGAASTAPADAEAGRTPTQRAYPTGHERAAPSGRAEPASGYAQMAPGSTPPGSPPPGSSAPGGPAAAAGQTGPAAGSTGRGVRATPFARTLAHQHGIDLASVQPSGPHGEVKGRDVQAQLAQAAAPAGSAASGAAYGAAAAAGAAGAAEADAVRPTAPPEHRREALSSIRKSVAQNMLNSHQTIPPVTLNAKADVTRLMEVRKELNEGGEYRYSLNDFVLRATAQALLRYPRINVRLEDQEMVWPGEINLGMAVALEEGLIVPVIQNAEQKSLRGLAEESRVLASRARERTLARAEMSGATFTVTNLGMYGITTFTPIINPPEAAILGVGTVESQVKMVDGAPAERSFIALSLTIDHRIVDGAQGALFMNELTQLLEAPLRLIAE